MPVLLSNMQTSERTPFQFQFLFRSRSRPAESMPRPISSTTTATHSTIAPLPSDRFARAHPTYDLLDDHPSDSHSETRPARRLFPSFFGISLTRRSSSSSARKDSASASSRKPSFKLASRPATPDDSPYSIPVPSSPLPLSASPRRRSFGLATHRPPKPKPAPANPPVPPGRPHARRLSASSERTPHDSAVALPEELSTRTPLRPPPHTATRNKGKERETGRPLDFPSRSLPPDPSPISRGHLLSHPSHPIPRIVHTPPTPQRPADEVDLLSRPATSPPPVAPPKHNISHREQLLVSTSHSHVDPQPSKARFTPRLFGAKELPKIKETGSPQSTPPNGPSILARSMKSHRAKLGSFDFERPVSALNRSSSTVDRSKDKPPLERSLSNDPSKPRLPRQTESPLLSQSEPDFTGDTSVVSFSSVSVQTRSTGKGTSTPTGQSSSWGRASGRRVLRTSHGTFAFENPSSVPGSPNPQAPTLPIQNDLATTSARTKHSRGQSYNTSDCAESNPGDRKPKGKGRSLDLGLGLSWAPSRLREEVLMPGLILTREKAKNKTNGSDVTKVFESLLSESGFQTFKTYVHHFDAHVIPLEGPSGLLASVEKLLVESGLGQRERKKLMSEFTLFVESHNG